VCGDELLAIRIIRRDGGARDQLFGKLECSKHGAKRNKKEAKKKQKEKIRGRSLDGLIITFVVQ
jgi:hypothetical protein